MKNNPKAAFEFLRCKLLYYGCRLSFIAALLVSIGLALYAPFTGVAQEPPQSQEITETRYGDWNLRCEAPPGAQNRQCALIQFVIAEDRPDVGLTVIILKTADQEARLLRVLAPLGVLLPSGLGLHIDGEDVGRAGFLRCVPSSCLAEVIMEDVLLNKLQSGQTANFIVWQTAEAGIGIPISLTGFSAGYDALP